VITPSLPTFSIASAMILPISRSLFAELVPTCAISFGPLLGAEIRLSSSTTSSTALSMPRFSDIGLAPAVTDFSPSRKIACASTVAVVVPSPARSEVLVATSFTIWAPMFSIGSFSSISLATVTPSLVIVGLPNFLSMTTLRPFGPRVAFTASAMMLTPLSSELRASSSNLSCFGMDRVPPYSRMARTSSSRRMRYSLSSILTSEPEYLPNRILSPAFTSSGIFLPSSPTFPVPAAITLPSCGFSLAVSGMMIPPRRTSCSSSRSTRMRSCSGRIFMVSLPPWCFVDVALASSGDGVTILQCRLPVSTQFQRVLNIRAELAGSKGKIHWERNDGKKYFSFKCFASRGPGDRPEGGHRRLQRHRGGIVEDRADRPTSREGRAHLSHHQQDRRRGSRGGAHGEGRRERRGRLQQYRRGRGAPARGGRHQYSRRPHRDHRRLRVGASNGDRSARRRGRPLRALGPVAALAVGSPVGRRRVRKDPRRRRLRAHRTGRGPSGTRLQHAGPLSGRRPRRRRRRARAARLPDGAGAPPG